MDKINAGYKITDQISLANQHFVLGESTSPVTPAQFAVWQTNKDMTDFNWGHYFTEKSAAIADMVLRATYLLERPDGKPLAVDFLAENAQETLKEQFAEERAKSDIQETLEDILWDDVAYPCKRSVEEILKDPEFFKLAKKSYNNLDRSAANNALFDELSAVLKAQPKLRGVEPTYIHVDMNISPEEAALVQDILSMPTADVADKYGPLGDNITFVFPLENGMTGSLTLEPQYTPWGENELSFTEPHTVIITIFTEDGISIGSSNYTVEQLSSMGNNGPIGKYELQLPGDIHLAINLQENEALRRIGNPFVFRSTSEDCIYQEHDGETCTVLRTLTTEECDILQCGLMWEAQFPNGDKLHIFDSELELPDPSLSRKLPLTEQNRTAKEKAESEVSETGPKQPER